MTPTRKEIMALAEVISILTDYSPAELDSQLYSIRGGVKVYSDCRAMLISAKHRQLLVKALRHYARRDDKPRVSRASGK